MIPQHYIGQRPARTLRWLCLGLILVALLSVSPAATRAAVDGDDNQIPTGKIVNQQDSSNGRQSGAPNNAILENIFNIPIQTLHAVNNLVQSIVGNLRQAGGASFFQRTNGSSSSNVRNIHVDVDDEPTKGGKQ